MGVRVGLGVGTGVSVGKETAVCVGVAVKTDAGVSVGMEIAVDAGVAVETGATKDLTVGVAEVIGTEVGNWVAVAVGRGFDPSAGAGEGAGASPPQAASKRLNPTKNITYVRTISRITVACYSVHVSNRCRVL